MPVPDGRKIYLARAAFGIALYAALVLAPVLLMLLGPLEASRAPLLEFSVALAFITAGILGMEFALASRLRRLKAPYGVDAVYYLHRNMAVVALALAIAHPVLLFVVTPERIALLNVFTAPAPARYALAAVVSLAIVSATSIWRTRLATRYETWRHLHGALALAILALAWLHAGPVGIYTEGWKLLPFLAYPLLAVSLVAYTRIIKPLVQLRHPYRIADVAQETSDTWTLTVKPEGHPGMHFRPGQFLWITIGRSPFSIVEHPFSFSSGPRPDGAFQITVKELGDFTARIGSTAPGTVAYVDGPFGSFTPERYPTEGGWVLLAGGIGITPIMSMLRAAADAADDTPIVLVYGAATRDDLAFADDIENLKERLTLTTRYVLERPPKGWEGSRGFITRELVSQVVSDPNSREYFLCGPPAMIDAVTRVLLGMGVDRRRLHYERFAFV